MPIYEFYCPQNHHIYSFLARNLASSGKVPRCPENGKFTLERIFSPFAVTGRAREKVAAPPGAEDSAAMDRVMAEMERDFAGADENDPRLMAKMMRRMAEATGEKLPGPMEEMMQRLERGEDPEKLEEAFAGALDEPGDGEGEGDDAAAEGKDASRKAVRRLLPPRRDPTLYEITDYLD